MAHWYEPEEMIGGLWHRFISAKSSYAHTPDAAVTFEQISGFLPVFFRAIGGDPMLRFAPLAATSSSHRLGWLQRLGHDREKIVTPRGTNEVIALPDVIDFFPESRTNRDLYLWLAAYFACAAAPPESMPEDPMQADLAFIRWAHGNALRVLTIYPGIRGKYDALCAAFLTARLMRPLPPAEAAMEALVHSLLTDTAPAEPGPKALWDYVCADGPMPRFKTPESYHPLLPLPLWGEIDMSARAGGDRSDEEDGATAAASRDEQAVFKRARRQRFDQANRKDPLLLNRFEAIQTWAEMLNLARSVDSDDEENARKVADEADEIVLTKSNKRAATRIRLDLDLPPDLIDVERLVGEHLVDEWDFTTKSYLKDHCRILEQDAGDGDDAPETPPARQRMISRVKRQFEALRPKREILRRQIDGFDLDMDALVMSYTDQVVSGKGSNHIYLATRDQARDLSVAILVDASLSTDAWIEGKQVIDVERETLSVMAHGLDACGDRLGIFSFTSRRRDQVFVSRLKGFEEKMGPIVDARIAAMKPGFYTRIGAALRHVSHQLDNEPSRHRLLLVLTDGKPNDLDHYEGRYGVEDTRIAVREARQRGQSVFGVTIDKQAQDYFPTMFGRGSYSIVSHLGDLPSALPAIYRSITSQ